MPGFAFTVNYTAGFFALFVAGSIFYGNCRRCAGGGSELFMDRYVRLGEIDNVRVAIRGGISEWLIRKTATMGRYSSVGNNPLMRLRREQRRMKSELRLSAITAARMGTTQLTWEARRCHGDSLVVLRDINAIEAPGERTPPVHLACHDHNWRDAIRYACRMSESIRASAILTVAGFILANASRAN